MSIQFVPIDKTNYLECIDLQVDEVQKHYVAPNVFSLAQSAYEPDMYPLAIYRDKKMVGFLLYDFDGELGGWSMSRFMIDKALQGQGLGKQALEAFLEYFFSKYGVANLYTSVEVDNPAAISLYEKMGFQRGEIFEYDAGGHHYTEMRMVYQRKDQV